MPTALGRILIVASPVLLAATFVLTVYADTAAFVYEAWRSLWVSVAITALVQVALTVVLRDVARGSVVVGTVLILIIDPRIGLIVAWLWLASIYARRKGHRVDLTGFAAALLLVLFAVSAGRAVSSEGFDLGDLSEPSNGVSSVSGDTPDVFLIMLDGYPRGDTLSDFGYDNRWFELELERRGFAVADRSTSSYSYTGLVLAAMFNMAHLPDIDELYPAEETHVGQTRALVGGINHNEVLRQLERRGYWTVSAGLTEVRGSMRSVDEYVDGGEIRLWERQLLQRTALWPVLCEVLVIPQHRSLIESTFVAVEDVADSSRDFPTFMFTHVMSPHTPIVFDRDGKPIRTGSSDCAAQFGIDATLIGLEPEAFGAAMSDQVHYLNTRTLAAIDQLVASRPSAVVIVFSDHGARHTEELNDEWFRTFFASRTPGRGEVFEQDSRSIDIFPTLFREYFDLEFPQPDNRRFMSRHGLQFPLAIDPWTEGVR